MTLLQLHKLNTDTSVRGILSILLCSRNTNKLRKFGESLFSMFRTRRVPRIKLHCRRRRRRRKEMEHMQMTGRGPPNLHSGLAECRNTIYFSSSPPTDCGAAAAATNVSVHPGVSKHLRHASDGHLKLLLLKRN